METVVDLHWDVTNLAKVVQDVELAPQLYRRLRRTLLSEQLHRDAAKRYAERGYCPDVSQPDLDRAYDYFLCAWLGRNGVAGTHSYNQGFCVRYTANGGHAPKRWDSAVRSIPAWRRRMANLTILNRDMFKVLPRILDEAGTAIYCDPPYLIKGAKYIHDFESGDHEQLAEALGRFRKARVVVSYYDHPLLAELYPEWTRRVIEVSKALAHQGRRGKNDTKAREVLLMNGPSYGKATERMLF
jgi:DNA adenine methylase